MRKILFIIVIILLFAGAAIVVAEGIELGSFDIWGIRNIIAKNEEIDIKNIELSNLVSITYPATLEDLGASSKTLDSTKQEYEDKAVLVSNSKYYMQTEKYEIEFLWTKLGNHAKANNVQIKIDVVNSSTSGLYDLNFTIAGTYVDVTEFIYDLENDSKLGFKIEDFHMSSAGEGVQGAFSCKEISINIESAEGDVSDMGEESVESGDATSTTNSTSENTTDTTNTNNTVENEAIEAE